MLIGTVILLLLLLLLLLMMMMMMMAILFSKDLSSLSLFSFFHFVSLPLLSPPFFPIVSTSPPGDALHQKQSQGFKLIKKNRSSKHLQAAEFILFILICSPNIPCTGMDNGQWTLLLDITRPGKYKARDLPNAFTLTKQLFYTVCDGNAMLAVCNTIMRLHSE